MGISYAHITLTNPRRPELTALQVRALADTGAITLFIPEHVAVQLELEPLEKREVTLADGRRLTVPYVGPLQINFENRNSFGGAMVMGDEVLLGAIQMEDMDLVVVPRDQRVAVNPSSPNLPSVLAKRAG